MIVINIDTPSELELCKKLVKYIDNLGDKIKVNRMYSMLKPEWLNEGLMTHRHGFRFEFAFEDEEIASQFKNDWQGEEVKK